MAQPPIANKVSWCGPDGFYVSDGQKMARLSTDINQKVLVERIDPTPLEKPEWLGSPVPAKQITLKELAEIYPTLPNVARGGQFIAPPGACEYCDRRRAATTARMKRRRAKDPIQDPK